MGLSLFLNLYLFLLPSLSDSGKEVRREREGEKQRNKWIQHKDHHHQKRLASTMGLSLRIQHKDHHRQKTLASSMGLSLFFSIYTSFFSLLFLIRGREVRREREGEKQRDKWIQQHKDHRQKTLASTMGLSLFFSIYTSFFSLLSLIRGREVRREREGEKQRDKWIQHKDHHRQKTLASTMGMSFFSLLSLI